MNIIMAMNSLILSITPVLFFIFIAGLTFSYLLFNGRPRSAIDDSIDLAKHVCPDFIRCSSRSISIDGKAYFTEHIRPGHISAASEIMLIGAVSGLTRGLFSSLREIAIKRCSPICSSENSKASSVGSIRDLPTDGHLRASKVTTGVLHDAHKRPLFLKRNIFSSSQILTSTRHTI